MNELQAKVAIALAAWMAEDSPDSDIFDMEYYLNFWGTVDGFIHENKDKLGAAPGV